MNERIQELANKAGAEVKIIHGDILYISKADLDIEKFAELIVLECLEVIEAEFGGGNGDGVEWDRAVDFTYNDVVKHFGLEE